MTATDTSKNNNTSGNSNGKKRSLDETAIVLMGVTLEVLHHGEHKKLRLSNMQKGEMLEVVEDDAADTDDGKKKKQKKKKEPKDPNAPKQPLTAYWIYQMRNLDKFKEHIKQSDPEIKNLAAAARTMTSTTWHSLTAEEKAPYEDEAAAGKREYAKLKEAYDLQKSRQQAGVTD